jgi:hypothetical protein
MTTTYRRPRDAAVTTRSADEHRFAIGQKVRMSGGFAGLSTRTGEIYQITGKLPPSNGEPQYRIRCESEAFERVATEARLEPADSADTMLLERTFHA